MAGQTPVADSERSNMDRIWYNEIGITRIYKDWPTPKTENFFSFDGGYSDSDRFIDSELPDNEQEAFISGLLTSENISIEIERAQDKVSQRLAHTTDMVLTFLQDKFTLTSQEESFLDNMESIADVITAFKALLSMTPAQKTIVEEFHADYQAWIALEQEE